MSELTIGILGGMGPRATVEFEKRLIERYAGGDQAVPKIVSVNNTRTPDRSAFLSAGGNDPLDELLQSAKLMKLAGVDVVCMPCNTAHSSKILPRLMALLPLPIIDMPAACLLQAELKGYKRVMILGTEGTRLSEVFDSRAINIEVIYPNQIVQQAVNKLISSVKNKQRIRQQDKAVIKQARLASNADVVLLACTELCLLSRAMFEGITVIDSLDVLADRCAAIITSYTNVKETRNDPRPIYNF